MAEGPTSHAATANCPMLCVIPPTTLTPKAEMCKWVLFFNKFMIIRLSTLPARLYRNPNRLPKVKAFNSPRTMLTVSAWQKPFLYKTSTITRLASPSLIPGNGIGSGKKTFNITEYESDGGKNSKFSDCVDVRFHISLLFGIIVQ